MTSIRAVCGACGSREEDSLGLVLVLVLDDGARNVDSGDLIRLVQRLE
jgi:hypothetical protein